MGNHLDIATFAGGCFWCMVKPFDQFEGIEQIISGYMGGHIENPTYEQVKAGHSGHYEVVQITYNPKVFSYEQLIDIFWQQIDPTDNEGQFHDRGDSYRAAVFYHTDEQRKIAEQSKDDLALSERFNRPIVTEIKQATTFYPAEEYHQDYYKKNKKHYLEDRKKSGRDEFIANHWE